MSNALPKTLDAELADLQNQIRADASNANFRVHLFQLLCVMGNWKRALSQLQVSAQMAAKALPMAQTYREAIKCELFRKEVFEGKRTPQIMGTPPPWIGPMIEALKHDGTNDFAAAAELRASAMDAAEANACSIDGTTCEWLADADSRLGPVLEVIANGQYYWLPLASCSGLILEPPTDLRDLVWAPGEVMLPNEGRVAVLIPTRYPGTEVAKSSDADALKRSKRTEWTEPHPGMWFGTGQRLWASDLGDHAILDTRRISMDTLAAPVVPPVA
jgi:type VI secretion system protein ImpE